MQHEEIEDATKQAIARLPGLEIEIVHQRRSPVPSRFPFSCERCRHSRH